MTSAHLQQWIQHPETLDKDSLYELRTLVARYPYFQTLRLLYLKNLYLLHDAAFGAELRKAVLYVADRRTLFYLIEGDRYALRPHAETTSRLLADNENPGIDRTLSLIDAFLSTMPEEHSQPKELDYAMDYTAYLLQDGEEVVGIEAQQEPATPDTPQLRSQGLIDDFISQQGEAEEKEVLPESQDEEAEEEDNTPVLSEEELDDSYFTETLAKIYVKQQRYDKALEIIKRLSLNYPKKNAYFADQIRFLEKLIINAKSK